MKGDRDGFHSIRSEEAVSLTDSEITTSALQSSGGNIFVLSDEVRLLGDSDIKTFVNSGSGSGGNIEISTDSIVALNSSDILAFSIGGAGGNILLNTPACFGENYFSVPPEPSPEQLRTLDDNNRVDINATGLVSSGTITAPSVNFIENDLTELSDNLIDADTLVASSCIARDNTSGNLTLTGSDRLPQTPTEAPSNPYPKGTVQSTLPDASEPVTITEPQAVYRLADGRLLMGAPCDSQ